jgi:hypothetical protein
MTQTKPDLTQMHKYCEYCEEARTFRGVYESVAHADSGVWIHTLLTCRTCDAPVLVVQEAMPDGGLTEPTQLYPNQRGAELGGAPRKVRSAYLEAVRCFERAGAFTGAAIMCRRTLEALCAEQKATGRDLNKKLESLHQSGFIDKALLEWATELRFLGNEAAHGSRSIARQDAKDAIEFTEALLSYVYTYRQSFELFKRRRAESKKTNKPT